MQTLLDPYELAQIPAPPISRVRPATPAPLAARVEAEPAPVAKPAPSRPSADSSGRLRCWCSEDD